MRAIPLIAVAWTVVAATAPARASGPAGLLDGIDEVYVRVDYVSELVTGTGMKDHDLLIQLANRIRDAGLLVLSASPGESTGPLLALTLESVELPTGDLALHGTLELREAVELGRRPGIFTMGSTWYSSMLTAAPRTGAADESRAVVAALADQFVADLAAAASP
jgi:hypothetical protein